MRYWRRRHMTLLQNLNHRWEVKSLDKDLGPNLWSGKECRLTWWQWRKSGLQMIRYIPQTYGLWKEEPKTGPTSWSCKSAYSQGWRDYEFTNDSKTFHKLISNQRKTSNSQLHSLTVSWVDYERPEKIRNGWASHFQTLASRSNSADFDQNYKFLVDAHVESIEKLYREECSSVYHNTTEEITTALNRQSGWCDWSHQWTV